MPYKKKLMITLMSTLMVAPIIPITSMTHLSTNVQADAEPQFSKKAIYGKTWHQMPAANNINDVHVIKFESGAPIDTGHYVVEVNGVKFLAAGDSKLGRQIKAHQKQIKAQRKAMKKVKIKRQQEAQRRAQQAAKKAQEKRTQQKQNKQNQIKKNRPNSNKVSKSTAKPHKEHYGIIAIIAIIIIALLGWIFRSFTKDHHNN